jgi:hypothetical protein
MSDRSKARVAYIEELKTDQDRPPALQLRFMRSALKAVFKATKTDTICSVQPLQLKPNVQNYDFLFTGVAVQDPPAFHAGYLQKADLAALVDKRVDNLKIPAVDGAEQKQKHS